MEKLKEKVLKEIENAEALIKFYDKKASSRPTMHPYYASMLSQVRERKKILDSIWREIPNAPRIPDLPQPKGGPLVDRLVKPLQEPLFEDYGVLAAGRVYEHYKGGKYRIVTFAVNEESTHIMVIYRSLENGEQYTRPYDGFVAQVYNKDNEYVPRFREVPW